MFNEYYIVVCKISVPFGVDLWCMWYTVYTVSKVTKTVEMSYNDSTQKPIKFHVNDNCFISLIAKINLKYTLMNLLTKKSTLKIQ